MYPTENVYITEAVRNFFKKEETENVMEDGNVSALPFFSPQFLTFLIHYLVFIP